MRVLIDAQLPQRLAHLLSSFNIDSKHTLDLPQKNATPDQDIIQIANEENRVIVSKDSDF